jgi:hypothetical protein
MDFQTKRLGVHKSYVGKFQKLIGPVEAAKLMQLEGVIQSLLDLQIQSNLPLIEKTAAAEARQELSRLEARAGAHAPARVRVSAPSLRFHRHQHRPDRQMIAGVTVVLHDPHVRSGRGLQSAGEHVVVVHSEQPECRTGEPASSRPARA